MRSRTKLREPFTYFLDRCLGDGIVPEALRADGFTVVLHRDEFNDDTTDVDWLTAIDPTLVVLTKDKRIRSNAMERDALLGAGLATFMLTSGQMSGSAMAEAFIAGRRSMERALRRFAPPFIASVSGAGSVTVLYDRDGAVKPPVVLGASRKKG